MDANEYALNKHMDEVEKYEKAQAEFDMEIATYLQDMEDIYYEIRKLAEDFGGYDLSDYCEECVSEVLCIKR